MEFVNDTPYPALSFEGIDQLSQTFHVVVMRMTCIWNEQGLLLPSDNQDPLCMTDVIADEKDSMSGVIEESDLCHYKPNCDILVVGSAYTPKHKQSSFVGCVSRTLLFPNPIITITIIWGRRKS